MEVEIAKIRTLGGDEIRPGLNREDLKKCIAIEYSGKYYLLDGKCRISRFLEMGERSVDIPVIPIGIVLIGLGIIAYIVFLEK